MGRKAKILLAALIAWPLWAQDTGNLVVNPSFEQGALGWNYSFPAGVYGGCGPAGGACFVFSFNPVTLNQTVVTPETYTDYTVSFQYRLPCNNSIFGYCENPNGPRDWLTANLNLYLGGEPVQSVNLLSLQTYQPQYETLSLTGTSSAFNVATISFTGQDTGFWFGPYGPQVDNVSLSFGGAQQPEPEPTPVPVPDAVNPAPDVAPDPTETQTEVLQNEPEPEQEAVVEAAVEEEMIVEEAVSEEDIVSDDVIVQEEIDENQAEDANDEPLSPDQLQALAAGDAPGAPTDEEVAQATEAVAQEAEAAEAARVEQSQSGPDQTVIASEVRRDRNVEFFQSEAAAEADLFARETVIQASLQTVAFVAQADAQYAAQYGEQTTTETAGVTYAIQPVEGPTFQPVITTTIGSDTSTPSGQAQQMELLGMGMQGDLAAGPVVDVGDVNTGDGETMAQLGAVPAGYSAYTQARIPDMPFYQPRDIYKGRRIPDANMALYRMMSGQDARWQDMVDEQYE